MEKVLIVQRPRNNSNNSVPDLLCNNVALQGRTHAESAVGRMRTRASSGNMKVA